MNEMSPIGFSPASPFFDPSAGIAHTLAEPLVEARLLGLVLCTSTMLSEIPDSFNPQAFTAAGFEHIWRAIVACEPEPRRRLFDEVTSAMGGDADLRAYLPILPRAIIHSLPGAAAQAAAVVTDRHKQRRLLETADGIYAALKAREREPASAILNRVMGEVEAIASDERGEVKTCLNLGEGLRRSHTAVSDILEGKMTPGVSTGFASIDRVIGSLEDGTLTVLGGRTAMGKSALALQFALNAARAGHPVAFISLEMSAMQLARRAQAAALGVSVETLKVRPQEVNFADLLGISMAMRDWPMMIEEAGGLTAADIVRKVSRIKSKLRGLRLIVIDHAHIVRGEDSDRRQGGTFIIEQVSLAAKQMAKTFSCPVVLLAQLNRGVEGREDKRPTLADLRQSGSLEQDADTVGLLYRPEYYLSKSAPEKAPTETSDTHRRRVDAWTCDCLAQAGKAELILAKVRDGEPQIVRLGWDGPTTSFSELSA